MKNLLVVFHPFVKWWDKSDRRMCRSLPWPIRYCWCGLWNRRDESHPCYDQNRAAMSKMSPAGRMQYVAKLDRRRQQRHEKENTEPLTG